MFFVLLTISITLSVVGLLAIIGHKSNTDFVIGGVLLAMGLLVIVLTVRKYRKRKNQNSDNGSSWADCAMLDCSPVTSGKGKSNGLDCDCLDCDGGFPN
ncbi:hypothetical protein LC040_01510 [Bacillus tianshenii]|nr:hypothetical protein LC040_01510 [Bacillus tianshenii]